MSDDILNVLTQKESELEVELGRVRAALAAMGVGTASKGSGKQRVPKVSLTANNDDEAGGTLPAPQRKMSKAARHKLSVNMKARWAALKAKQKAK